MKKFGLILSTLVLFSFSLYLAYIQGSVTGLHASAPDATALSQTSPVEYSGVKAAVANLFAGIFNFLMHLMGQSILLSMIALALLVELVLLYPSVKIQLKQKKIHIFHKKLIDRFNKGELGVSETEQELYKIYDVNEKIHFRGALMVVAQVIVFFFTFWGLSLIVRVPGMLHGSWNILNFSLLSRTSGNVIPFVAGLIYFAHGMTKMFYKAKEDYISKPQAVIAFIFSVVGSVLVYMFSELFPLALTLYFVTLVTFATVRYILIEMHSRDWGKYAQKELIEMLKKAEPHKDRFEYFSRLWNHLPIIRYINFNLLEEALSMSLGLLLALSFFGAFQKTDASAYLNNGSNAIVQVQSNLLT